MSNCNNICHGTCASFDCSKGYGWITPNDNSVSIFVHWKDIITYSHFKSLAPGQHVQYQPIFGQNGKRKAINVSVVPVPVPQHNNHSIASHNFTMQYNNNNNNNNSTNTNINNNNINNNNNYNHNQYNSYSQKPIQSTYQQPQYNNNYNNNNNMNTMNTMNNMNNMLSQNYNNNNNVPSINTTTNSIRLPPNNIPNKSNNNAANALTQTTNVNRTNNECKDHNEFNVETKFKWQWLDDCNTWQDFTKDINERILSANADTIFYKIGEFSYKFEINRYDVSEGKQTNETTNTRRHCRKTEKKFAVHQGLTLKTMLDSSWNDKYPSWWFDKDTKLHVAKLVDWPLNNEICLQIIEMFDDSCNQFAVSHDIEAIYSVQNKYLWKNYQFQRELHSEALGKNKLNERYLFHGTEYEATQKITVQGFLRDHGKVMAYGRGTYFAADAAMSIDYSAVDDNDYQWMFLCAVILGESICGRKSYNVPPTKANSCVHYESMVDDLNNPKIFVISKDYMAYPLFLIKFKQQQHALCARSIFGAPLSMNNIINGNNKKQHNKTNKSLIPIKTKGATATNHTMKKTMPLPNISNILNQISRKPGGALSGLLKPTAPTPLPLPLLLRNLISANNALVYQPTLPPPLYISNTPSPSHTFSIMNNNKSLHHTPAMPSAINNNLSVPALQYTLTMPATMNTNLSVSATQNKQSTVSNNKSLHYPPTINNNLSVATQNKQFPMGLPAFSGLPTSDPMANNVKVTPVPTTLSLSPIVEQSQTNSFVQYMSSLSTSTTPRSLTPYPSYLHSQPIVGSPMPPMPPLNLLQL